MPAACRRHSATTLAADRASRSENYPEQVGPGPPYIPHPHTVRDPLRRGGLKPALRVCTRLMHLELLIQLLDRNLIQLTKIFPTAGIRPENTSQVSLQLLELVGSFLHPVGFMTDSQLYSNR